MCKVSILLSVYRPNLTYLIKQLDSLNTQDYPDLELLVWNDCPDSPLDEALFKEHITNFPIFFYQDSRNYGYCKAFEQLTKLCTGTYLTFCDQDDIWLPNKISASVKTLEENHALGVVCDRAIIDANDTVVCPSVRHTSRHHNETWASCSDITVQNSFACHGPGLCILAQAEAAKSAIPFCEVTGHDKWLLSCLSAQGKIAVLDSPVVHYRRHGNNVSGVLTGIHSKQDYYDKRVAVSKRIISEFISLYPDDPHIPYMERALAAQLSHNPFKIFRYRKAIPDLYLFQICLSLCPDFLFRLALKFLRRRVR